MKPTIRSGESLFNGSEWCWYRHLTPVLTTVSELFWVGAQDGETACADTVFRRGSCPLLPCGEIRSRVMERQGEIGRICWFLDSRNKGTCRSPLWPLKSLQTQIVWEVIWPYRYRAVTVDFLFWKRNRLNLVDYSVEKRPVFILLNLSYVSVLPNLNM